MTVADVSKKQGYGWLRLWSKSIPFYLQQATRAGSFFKLLIPNLFNAILWSKRPAALLSTTLFFIIINHQPHPSTTREQCPQSISCAGSQLHAHGIAQIKIF